MKEQITHLIEFVELKVLSVYPIIGQFYFIIGYIGGLLSNADK